MHKRCERETGSFSCLRRQRGDPQCVEAF
ncbi:hypothetical protein E2C01_089711 [Portunus trituberculatus]|uniref:Uncharacterized protein n=1 Tax=Portunus trituberculatus TaxID=210409 RepID=A0A5B7JN62_PORTR|nr:hypothetical protein [Portunus trituberculatus]